MQKKIKLEKHTIQAFTVTEVLITMILTSIVIGAAVMLWQMSEKESVSFGKQTTEISHKILFFSTIRNDIVKAEVIKQNDNTLMIYNEAIKSIDYQFTQNAVIRIVDKRTYDTIYRSAIRLQTRSHLLLKGMITEIHLQDSTRETVLYKQYTNCQLFNYTLQ